MTNNKNSVLKLTLKKKWFEMIKAGIKKEEYREVKEYWDIRLKNKKFKFVFFKNGYKKNAAAILVECNGILKGKAKAEWSDGWQGEVYIISLGAIIENN